MRRPTGVKTTVSLLSHVCMKKIILAAASAHSIDHLSCSAVSAVTILKSRSKIAIFCQNRPKSKSLHLLSPVSISSCVDFWQQLMDVTGLKTTIFVGSRLSTASILNTD